MAKNGLRVIWMTVAIVAGLRCVAGHAQSDDSSHEPPHARQSEGLEEIVVTATHRAESIQTVPMSITAVTADSLAKRSATNFFDYGSSIPNLSFGNTAEGTTSARTVAIRGISDKNTTGFYIDDTPVSESLDPRIVDVSRIEVLRGPQGTLYGARSMGGTVRLITTQPSTTDFEGQAHASLSTTKNTGSPNYDVDAAANFPVIADRVGLRVVGVHEDDAGYFTRVYGPEGGPTGTVNNLGRTQVNGVSLASLIKFTDRLSATPRVLYQQTSVDGFPFADVAVSNGPTSDILRPTSFIQRRRGNVPEFSRDKWLLASFDVHYDQDFGRFTSSTSYFWRRTRDVEDQTDFIDAAFGVLSTPTNAEIDYQTDSLTQEFRFASSFSGPFQIVSGLFFNRNEFNRIFPPDLVPGIDAQSGDVFGTDLVYQSNQRSLQKDYSAYAEGTLHIVGGLNAIAGARAFEVKSTAETSSDGIAVGGPTVVPSQTQTEHGVQPKFSLQYQFAAADQLYATAAKGFRPGGVNGVIPTALGCAADLEKLGIKPADAAFFRSDDVWSYEAGVKTSLLDRRLTANVSGFVIDWSDIQQRIQLGCGFGFRGNAGEARSQGVEVEASARPIDGLIIDSGFGYTDARFRTTSPGTNFKKGDRLPQVPKYTLNLGADYSFSLSNNWTPFIHADYRYVSDSISVLNATTDADGNIIPRIRPSYAIADLRGGVSIGKQEFAVFVKNITDERASLGDALAVAAEAPNRARVSINQPRTFGIEYRARF